MHKKICKILKKFQGVTEPTRSHQEMKHKHGHIHRRR